mmetsp:Transcript_16298/g.37616  ORF Transcript_16298/g.37616 Transcript_16298/m.37616 type:complete len:231 (-) Transcript_16298:21-713(-)
MAVQQSEPGASAASSSINADRARQTILAASRQQGNPMLEYVRATLVEYLPELTPDYLVTPDTGVLFISLRFHRLHPEYLQQRIKGMEAASSSGSRYRVKVLLCRVDLEQPEEPLEQITLTSFHSKLSLLLAWTDAEAAAYLEMLHRQQHKGPEQLMGSLPEGDHHSRLAEVLTTVRGVNKSDASMLMLRFGSLAKIATATDEELVSCPGIGERKVKQLHHVLQEPFFVGA